MGTPFAFGLRRRLAPIVGAALLVTTVTLSPASIFALGEPVEIVAEQSTVVFPSSMKFNLILERNSPISEIRLYYKAVGSPVWSYTYPTLDHSSHIEASYSLKTSGSTYLPPGTEVEYYYSIRYTYGKVVRTPLNSILYLDNRFDWNTTEIGPITLYWHDQSETRVQQVADQARQSIARAGSILGVSPSRPINGIIYNSFPETIQAFPDYSATLSAERIFQGFAFKNQRVFIGVGLHPNLIVHEAAHFLLGDAIDSPKAYIPKWVNEGFASYVEPGRATTLRSSDSNLPLRSMSTLPGHPDDIGPFYAKAASVIEHLVESYGNAQFRSFTAALNSGTQVDTALLSTYGFGIDALDRQWQEHITAAPEVPRRSEDPSSWIFLESTLLGFLVLVVMAMILGKLLYKLLVKRSNGLGGLDN
jgi:hypothetical protein